MKNKQWLSLKLKMYLFISLLVTALNVIVCGCTNISLGETYDSFYHSVTENKEPPF